MKRLFLWTMVLAVAIGGVLTANTVNAKKSNDGHMSSLYEQKIDTDNMPSSNEKILKELKNKALSNISEGWFYVREYTQYDVDVPTEEGIIPLVNTRTESWFYINSSGMVEKSISVEKTIDGQITQVGIFSDGTSWNTMVDEIRITESFVFDPFDYGLSYHIKKSDTKNEKIDKDGKKAIKFKIKNTENEPVKLIDYSKKLLAMEYEYTFDYVTGFLVSAKNIAYLEDGTQREFMFVQIEEVRFNAEPPLDILEYFDVKKNREMQQ